MASGGNQFGNSPYGVPGQSPGQYATPNQYPMPNQYGAPPAKGSNATIVIVIIAVAMLMVLIMGCGIGLLLPAIQAAREAARRMSDQNNLKQVTLAMHNFADANKHLPSPATIGPNGEELWSWRVEVLPYIEASPTYSRIDRENPRPWDDPQNAFLLENMPPTYMSSRTIPTPGQSNIFVVATMPAGPESVQAAFTHGETVQFQDVSDGTSNTIMAIMLTNASVEWTQPSAMTPDQAYAALQNERDYALVAMMDGSVRTIPTTIDKNIFMAMCTRNGGEEIPGGF